MGILNRTPDSFFEPAATYDLDALFARAERSSPTAPTCSTSGGVRPARGRGRRGRGARPRRPGRRGAGARFDVPISVDTWRASVAAAAFAAGAVAGQRHQRVRRPRVPAPSPPRAGASVVATHIRLAPRVADPDPHYDDVTATVRGVPARAPARGRSTPGVAPDRVVARRRARPRQDGRASRCSCCATRTTSPGSGSPLLLSASNKTFLGVLFDLDVAERRDASLAAAALGVAAGCRVVRAHDVAGRGAGARRAGRAAARPS